MGGTSTVAPIDPKEDEVKSGLGRLVTYGSVVDIAMMVMNLVQLGRPWWDTEVLDKLGKDQVVETISEYLKLLNNVAKNIDKPEQVKDNLKRLPINLIDPLSASKWQEAVEGKVSKFGIPYPITKLMVGIEAFLRGVDALFIARKWDLLITQANLSAAVKNSKAIRCRAIGSGVSKCIKEQVVAIKLELVDARDPDKSEFLGDAGALKLRGIVDEFKKYTDAEAVCILLNGFNEGLKQAIENREGEASSVTSAIIMIEGLVGFIEMSGKRWEKNSSYKAAISEESRLDSRQQTQSDSTDVSCSRGLAEYDPNHFS